MNYTCTRDASLRVSASEAILKGLAADGGLFVPAEFPQLDAAAVADLDYPETAAKILALYLTEYDPAFLRAAARQAYSAQNFDGKAGSLQHVSGATHALELWHGPTCAFKDYALQLMPKLLVQAKKNLGDSSITKILVATSGDTGKAALAGYAGLDGIRIAVFYPNDGTSEIQRLQMATQEGENVAVYAVHGNFDDAQTGVKRVFADRALAAQLLAKGEKLSSANSINWGRLVPQIVYYYYSYAQLVAGGAVHSGDEVDFCVPTGNFGDILAGYYAKRMGLPVGRLICASNRNNVLTDFLTTGTYNSRRTFYKTSSPSMDILVSSNLERLLYHAAGDEAVRGWMRALAETGSYTVPADVLASIRETFCCGWADEDAVRDEIGAEERENGYLCDPHTAVAFRVAAQQAGENPCVVLSTASPYKFPGVVLAALGEQVPANEFEAMAALHARTGVPVPPGLAALQTKPVRFDTVIAPGDIGAAALAL